MYIPRHFAVTDPEALHQVIREHSFATLVTAGDGEPFATHVPLLLENSTLVGHMAKANPHWKLFDGRTALAIFHGPHVFVSPRLYVTEPNVATWNYITVHAYGTPVVSNEAEVTAEVLRHTASTYDPAAPAQEAHLQRLLPGVVAFRMPIDRLEGKFKLNQNKAEEDRQAVMAAFEASSDPVEQAMAREMRRYYS